MVAPVPNDCQGGVPPFSASLITREYLSFPPEARYAAHCARLKRFADDARQATSGLAAIRSDARALKARLDAIHNSSCQAREADHATDLAWMKANGYSREGYGQFADDLVADAFA